MEYFISKRESSPGIFQEMLNELKDMLNVDRNICSQDNHLKAILNLGISKIKDTTGFLIQEPTTIKMIKNFNSKIFFPLFPIININNVCRIKRQYYKPQKIDEYLDEKNYIKMKHISPDQALTNDEFKYIISGARVKGIEVRNHTDGDEIYIEYDAGYQDYQSIPLYKEKIISFASDVYKNPMKSQLDFIKKHFGELVSNKPLF